MRRRAAFVLGGVDLAIWAVIAYSLFLSGADPATAGLDVALGGAIGPWSARHSPPSLPDNKCQPVTTASGIEYGP